MSVSKTSSSTPPRYGRLLCAVSVALLLGACSDSSTSEEEDTGASIDSAGRLALFDSEESAVVVYDLDTESELQRFALTGDQPSLYASPDKRYAVVVQRNDNQVSFVDSGLYTEDHVDHLHDYAEDPVMLDFTLSGIRPTHYSAFEEYGSVFFDAEEGATSTVTVLSDADIGAGSVTGELTLANNMHGAARLIDDTLFATYRDPSITDTTLPAAVERYSFEDGSFTFEHRYEEACPLLHGHASNESYIAFGCGDGTLLIDLTEEDYPARKLPNPESIAEEGRIGTVIAHEEADELVGVAGQQVFVIDPNNEPAYQELSFPSEVSKVAQGFNVDGETYYILGDDGMLYLYDVEAQWAALEPVAVADSVGEDDASPRVVSSAAAERLYVLNTNGQKVIEVDSLDGSIVRTLDLDFTASAVTWLGLSESHDHQN
ncbi:hypothetical protein ACUNV4_12220 [Granulosicoccus sp. 3-233]|uniref:hypothetical protein n=1 Tax=Granulosicoccus sp. 3-233 TaxID=3417969 RepID=UPI003D353013